MPRKGNGVNHTIDQPAHSLAECLAVRIEKPSAAFCGSARCLKERGANIYRVRGLGRGVKRLSRKRGECCEACQMLLFFSNDYYLLKDGRTASVLMRHDSYEAMRGRGKQA